MEQEYEERLQEELKERLGRFEGDTAEFRAAYNDLKKEADDRQRRFERALSRLTLAGGIAVLVAMGLAVLTVSYNTPLGIISWLAAAAFAVAPFVWRVRMMDARRHEALTLAYGFQRKAILEERAVAYAGSDADLRKELLRVYVQHWTDKSPEETMLALRGKGDSAFLSPFQAIADRFSRGGGKE